MNYLDKVVGLPKPSRRGYNTRVKHNYKPYIHRVKISGLTYYKVHIKRQNKSKIKYFKFKYEAEMFLKLLQLNPYL